MAIAIPESVEAAAMTPELVQNADNMDRETFCLHMTHRHNDSLGGMTELRPDKQTDYTEELWRTFHDRLHSVRIRQELAHEHEQEY